MKTNTCTTGMASHALTGRRFQEAFFQQMGSNQQFRLLFEHLPEIGFFAKDVKGRFVAAGPLLLRWAGCSKEEELLGRDDSATHSPETIKAIRADDTAVLESGQPLINRVEMLFTSQPGSGWYCTTKLPIFDTEGGIIGIMGVVRPYNGALGHLPQCAGLVPVLAYIDAHYAQRIAAADLAKLGGNSERQLNRHFQRVFRMTVQEFINHRRIQATMLALATGKTLAEIAAEHGFFDQSHFTRQFRRLTGETPAQFRARLASGHV